jgi:hypothetical protein
MKLITNTSGMVRAPELYQELAETHGKASITLYKLNQRDNLFPCKNYTLKSGRVEYWFTSMEAGKARVALAKHYGAKS